jgi:hypothetical protein
MSPPPLRDVRGGDVVYNREDMAPDAIRIFGRMILFLGIVLAAAGLFLMLGPRLPGFIGRLPGDVSFGRGNVRVYLPLGTCVLLSLILTIIYSLISWLRR